MKKNQHKNKFLNENLVKDSKFLKNFHTFISYVISNNKFLNLY